MMRERGERTVEKPAGTRFCPFDNPDCAVTCECGDDECHRYCLGPQEKNADDGKR